MWIADPQVSPDGARVAFTRVEVDRESDDYRTSLWILEVAGGRHATMTEKRPESWLMRVESHGHGVVSEEALTREQAADEFLLMGLRLAEGIDPARYARLAGRPLDPHRIAILLAEGAVELTANGMLRVTPVGFPVLDAVVADLAA